MQKTSPNNRNLHNNPRNSIESRNSKPSPLKASRSPVPSSPRPSGAIRKPSPASPKHKNAKSPRAASPAPTARETAESARFRKSPTKQLASLSLDRESQLSSPRKSEKGSHKAKEDNSSKTSDRGSRDGNEDDSKDALETNWNKVVDSFDDLNLDDKILRGIYAYGFENPSAIQQRAIAPILLGRDVIAQAQSGTGKTATFCISVLQNIDIEAGDDEDSGKKPVRPKCQALILAHTRELARQIHRVLISIGDYAGVKARACVGGAALRDEIRAIRDGLHVIVGTPGRVNDLIRRGYLRTDDVKMLVLDEADRLLSDGFKDQIYELFQTMPQDLQVCLFSATLPVEVLRLTSRFMRNPIRILVKQDSVTLDGIKQFYIDVEQESNKFSVLSDLYERMTISQCIIYCSTRSKVEWLTRALREDNFVVSSIHGQMEPQERELIMKEFRTGSSRVLVTTDLLARGIDVHQVSVVVNYDLPIDMENYIHRIGRSGRFGRKGVAINFLHGKDFDWMQAIEAHYATHVEPLPEDLSELF